MSLFQCENCGCCDNTALSSPTTKYMPDIYDWSEIEDRKGKYLCCVCAPDYFSDGNPTGLGLWHNQFERVFLPKGEFFTNKEGNLEHKATGSINFRKFKIDGVQNEC